MRSYLLYVLMHLYHLTNAHISETPLPTDLVPRVQTFPEPTTTVSPPSTPLKDCPACQLLGSALAICASLTPGFTALLPTAQANCLCYSSTAWQPNVFDGAVKTCADYASTAAPSAYTPLLNLEGFCNGIGNGAGGYVYGGMGGGMVTVTTTFTTTAASGSGSGASGGVTSATGASSVTSGLSGADGTSTAGSGSVLFTLNGQSGSSIIGTSSGAASSSSVSAGGSSSGSGSTTHTTLQATFTITPVATITAVGTTSNDAIRKEITTAKVVFISFAIALTLVFL